MVYSRTCRQSRCNGIPQRGTSSTIATDADIADSIVHNQLASIASASLTESDPRKAYKAALASYKDKKRRQQHEENEQQLLSFDELKAWSGLDDRLNLARQYNRRLGLSVPKDPNLAGSFFVNGKLFPLNDVSGSTGGPI